MRKPSQGLLRSLSEVIPVLKVFIVKNANDIFVSWRSDGDLLNIYGGSVNSLQELKIPIHSISFFSEPSGLPRKRRNGLALS